MRKRSAFSLIKLEASHCPDGKGDGRIYAAE